jgi:hypothetical protein
MVIIIAQFVKYLNIGGTLDQVFRPNANIP